MCYYDLSKNKNNEKEFVSIILIWLKQDFEAIAYYFKKTFM
jgi:hypothetical protein